MTWREWIMKYLTDNGLWSQEAEAVFERYIAVPGEDMQRRLNDKIDGYPPQMQAQMQAVLLFGLQDTALEWIDANKPRHWARPMFLSEKEREKLFRETGT